VSTAVHWRGDEWCGVRKEWGVGKQAKLARNGLCYIFGICFACLTTHQKQWCWTIKFFFYAPANDITALVFFFSSELHFECELILDWHVTWRNKGQWWHSDLILTYKMLFGLISISASDFFSFPNHIHNTRGHAYKLLDNHCRINVRQHFFTERVIKPWNSLRVTPHDFNSVNSFRTCLLANDLREFLFLPKCLILY